MRRLVAQHADLPNAWPAHTDAAAAEARRQLRIIDAACQEHGRAPASLVATTAVRCVIPGSGYVPRPDERPLEGTAGEMAEMLRGRAALGSVRSRWR